MELIAIVMASIGCDKEPESVVILVRTPSGGPALSWQGPLFGPGMQMKAMRGRVLEMTGRRNSNDATVALVTFGPAAAVSSAPVARSDVVARAIIDTREQLRVKIQDPYMGLVAGTEGVKATQDLIVTPGLTCIDVVEVHAATLPGREGR